jgi:hypothetical protein
MILSETWFMEGYIDFELQRYRLLAYLQDVKQSFDQTKLYPQLADIVVHYNNLVAFQNSKRLMQDQFPKKLDLLSLQKLQVVYERMLADNELMGELEQITRYAIDEMKGAISEGAEIYEFVEKQLQIDPVGIMPLYTNEGYIFLRYGGHSEVRIYNYTVTLFEHKAARYKGIKLEYLDSRTKNLANTYEQIKIDLVRAYRSLPNPAVYKVEYPLSIPLNETLLPVTKRVLMKHLCQDAGNV